MATPRTLQQRARMQRAFAKAPREVTKTFSVCVVSKAELRALIASTVPAVVPTRIEQPKAPTIKLSKIMVSALVARRSGAVVKREPSVLALAWAAAKRGI